MLLLTCRPRNSGCAVKETHTSAPCPLQAALHASAQQRDRLGAQLAAGRAQHQDVCNACHTLETKMAQLSKQSAEVEEQQTAHEADLQQLQGVVGGLQALMQHACGRGGPLSQSPRTDAACLPRSWGFQGLKALVQRTSQSHGEAG